MVALKIDIGCGSAKESGYLGIDRTPYPGVDIVCDINEGIPLPDNTAEFVMASRVLPYVDDLMAVMAEIYRISCHKAVVCILAPYAHSYPHSSNPFSSKSSMSIPRVISQAAFISHPLARSRRHCPIIRLLHLRLITGCSGWSYSTSIL